MMTTRVGGCVQAVIYVFSGAVAGETAEEQVFIARREFALQKGENIGTLLPFARLTRTKKCECRAGDEKVLGSYTNRNFTTELARLYH